MWVNGGLTREEDESRLIRTSCLMFLSCHADLHTLVRILWLKFRQIQPYLANIWAYLALNLGGFGQRNGIT